VYFKFFSKDSELLVTAGEPDKSSCGYIGFSWTRPSRFRIRLMVLSKGKERPSLLSSHLMAETPT
jgi:hypothetical protein